MKKHFIALAMLAVASPAAAQDVQLFAPGGGLTFGVGDQVTVTGQASDGVLSADLDLTFVLDSSGSMRLTQNVGGQTISRQQLQATAAKTVVAGLSEGSTISLVEFDSNANNVFVDTVLSQGTIGDINAGIDSVDASGTTSIASGLNKVVDNTVEQGDRVLLFADGGGGGTFANNAASQILASGGIVDTVALPGASVNALSAIANAGGGTFYDFRSNPDDIANILLGGGGGGLNGVTSVVGTLPDGSATNLTFNAFGGFSLPQFEIAEGDNVFSVVASFDGGQMLTASLTLVGVRDGTPVIPLPAAAWLLLAGLGSLAVLRRRAA
ncbi:VWA domain-containing protein [Jannaschia sp. LMIT008]|uniref:VWA domain-containing protein n=1 Tax=Jannaschia maritima TaxID=3032585 RepID=UPI0028114FC8|nr:VWA domain-containing protein [Jannaschia sp. LMIT008]